MCDVVTYEFENVDLNCLLKISENIDVFPSPEILKIIENDFYNAFDFSKDLIKEFLGIDVSKQLQSSDFGGELSNKQLQYCANDVVYLHKIFDNLKKILIREKRIQLYDKAKSFLTTRVELDYHSFKEDIWSH